MPNMDAAFAPFDDFKATQADLDRFAKLLEEDPKANLIERFEFFCAQNEESAQQSLGFVCPAEEDVYAFVRFHWA